MSPWRASLAFLALLFTSGVARAQTADSLASVSSELFPKVHDGDDPNRRIGFYVLRVNGTVPLHVAPKTYLLPGFKYEETAVSVTGQPDVPSPNLRTGVFSLGVAQGIGERFTLIASGGIGVASDFSQPVSGRDLVVTGTALVMYKLSPSLSLGAGIVYDQRTGTPLPLPALLLNWRLSQNVRIRGFVPARVDAEWRITPWFTTGLFASFAGDRYALGERTYGVPDLQIALSTAEIGPKATFSIGDWVHVDLSIAAPVYRRYDVYQDGDKIDGTALPIVPAYGVRFRIGPSLWDVPPATPAPTPPEEAAR